MFGVGVAKGPRRTGRPPRQKDQPRMIRGQYLPVEDAWITAEEATAEVSDRRGEATEASTGGPGVDEAGISEEEMETNATNLGSPNKNYPFFPCILM